MQISIAADTSLHPTTQGNCYPSLQTRQDNPVKNPVSTYSLTDIPRVETFRVET